MPSLPVSNVPQAHDDEAVHEAPAMRPPLPASGPRGAASGPHPLDRPESAPPPFDGRQIFFLFVGSAVCACLIFGGGVLVGRRVERRALAQLTTPAADPLATLDELANAEEALTFHRSLLGRPAGPGGRANRAERAEARAAEPASPAAAEEPRAGAGAAAAKPRYRLQSAAQAQKADALALLRKLREAGYKPTLLEEQQAGKTSYRVQLGDFETTAAAETLQRELTRKHNLTLPISKR